MPFTFKRRAPLGAQEKGVSKAKPVPRSDGHGSAAGTLRITEGFFDRHPRFFSTSETSAHPWRLNLRHEAIFTEHRKAIEGSSVLDIASHDGRWSLAALEAGASSVLGIEARADLVQVAEENLRESGADETRFRFVAGDVFDVLGRGDTQVDVVLCLGFLYHTLRYNELWTRYPTVQAEACPDRHIDPSRP